MRTKLICAALAVGVAAVIGFSKGTGTHALPMRAPEHHEYNHELVEKNLHDYYGRESQVRIVDSYDIDGTKVLNAVINRQGGECEATITAAGELMTMGAPEAITAIAPGAAETARLFKTPVTTVSREDVHSYFVTVKTGGLPYDVEFDAAGQIRNIKAPQAIFDDAKLTKVNGAEHHHMAEMAEKRFAGVHVDNVFEALHNPGYFTAVFRSDAGGGWAILNREQDVTEWRFPIHRDQLPEPVRRGIERELHGDRVVGIQMGAIRLYQVKQMIGGEAVTMLVKPDGEVIWISTRELHRHHAAH